MPPKVETIRELEYTSLVNPLMHVDHFLVTFQSHAIFHLILKLLMKLVPTKKV